MPTFYFVEKPEVIRAWLSNKGYNDTIHRSLLDYFHTKSSMNSDKLYDLINDKMTSLGFSGTIKDKLNFFFITKMNEGDPRVAERRFWRDFSTDFELVDVSGQPLETPDGIQLQTPDGTGLEAS